MEPVGKGLKKDDPAAVLGLSSSSSLPSLRGEAGDLHHSELVQRDLYSNLNHSTGTAAILGQSSHELRLIFLASQKDMDLMFDTAQTIVPIQKPISTT